jgi:hypothetical protein
MTDAYDRLMVWGSQLRRGGALSLSASRNAVLKRLELTSQAPCERARRTEYTEGQRRPSA